MDRRQIWQSQNFIKSPEFVSNLLDKTNIKPNDLVLEIGPGKGIITKKLSERVQKVVAIEIDHRLASDLNETFRNTPNINIVEADFLKWRLPDESYKIFSNIPFNMTADIMRKITEDKNPPLTAYLIMQDKAAFRFMGKPFESQASILVKPWFDLKIIQNIDRREFYPTPSINAVLVELSKRENPLVSPQYKQIFRDFVVFGFNQWQPTLLDSYKNIFSSKQRNIIARDIGIKNQKPSELTEDQWIKLFTTYITYVPKEKQKITQGAEGRLERKQKSMTKLHRTR